MNSQELTLKLSGFWKTLYPDYPGEILTDFIDELEMVSQKNVLKPNEKQWFKKCVVYCLYVDLFNETFEGLISKLDYLQDLGAGCLWLLPILSSPMKDQGFDISDYKKIRDDLFRKGLNTREQEEVFQKFINAAHGKNIKVIFDIALNHSSDQHEWFRGINTPDSKYKDYYIWAQDTEKYKNVPVLFAPLEKSNWQPKKINGEEWYYFHRFFNHQPDLNYKNPRLLLEMCRSLVFWLQKGIDGFRADAIPFIWKEDDTDCMNLSQAHVVIKFFRTILDYLRPETLLLAEACLPTEKIVEYFGEGTKSISCTGKATITNMGAELGATCSIFPYDDRMKAYLNSTGRAELAAVADQHKDLLCADPEVAADPKKFFDEVYEIDLSALEPHLVGPHSPDIARPISAIAKEAKEKGVFYLEGKDYILQDGDIMHVRFNI